MGDVTDRTSPARFTMDVDQWLLVYARVSSRRIDGGTPGTDVADLTIRLDARVTPQYDHTLREIVGFGPTGEQPTYLLRITEDEQSQWVFHRGDILVFEWANPDVGNIEWSIDVGLADAARA